MIDAGVDFDLEKLLAKYRRIGLFMPLVVKDYNNRLAFNTRSLAKSNLIRKTTTRSASIKYITGGRVLSVRTAKFSRNVERIKAEVGGRVVPQARDPHFMARLEFGGAIPAGKFGQTAMPTVAGARSGSLSRGISKGMSVPRLAAAAVNVRNVTGPPKQKRAVALAIAVETRKKTVMMRDTKGRMSIYRVKGSGRGKKRRVSEVKKIWTLSTSTHTTSGVQWLSNAVAKASAERVKVFRRIAEKHITRKALRGK